MQQSVGKRYIILYELKNNESEIFSKNIYIIILSKYVIF